MVTVEGETSNRHGAGACDTSTSCCATTIRPRRGVPFGFGSTEYVTVAAPCPLVAVRLTHGASVDADQVQSRDVATVSVPVPPLAGTSAVLLVTEISHFSPDGPVTLVVVEPHASAAHAVASTAARKNIRVRTQRARINPERSWRKSHRHITIVAGGALQFAVLARGA